MDAIVEAALRKWPNVPHCYGWLALDARGNWYMRDDRIQHAGPFPQVKGSRIEHAKLLAFIERNYAHDDAGAWFFQNGPLRWMNSRSLSWRMTLPLTRGKGPAACTRSSRMYQSPRASSASQPWQWGTLGHLRSAASTMGSISRA
jgi:hypothetical protein